MNDIVYNTLRKEAFNFSKAKSSVIGLLNAPFILGLKPRAYKVSKVNADIINTIKLRNATELTIPELNLRINAKPGKGAKLRDLVEGKRILGELDNAEYDKLQKAMDVLERKLGRKLKVDDLATIHLGPRNQKVGKAANIIINAGLGNRNTTKQLASWFALNSGDVSRTNRRIAQWMKQRGSEDLHNHFRSIRDTIAGRKELAKYIASGLGVSTGIATAASLWDGAVDGTKRMFSNLFTSDDESRDSTSEETPTEDTKPSGKSYTGMVTGGIGGGLLGAWAAYKLSKNKSKTTRTLLTALGLAAGAGVGGVAGGLGGRYIDNKINNA